MKFQIISDVHLEFYDEDFDDFSRFVVPEAPILGLLGDISALGCGAESYGYGLYVSFLNYCSSNWEQVYVITGNHEYYSSHEDDDDKLTMIEVDELITEICSIYDNVVFLQTNHDVIQHENGEYRIIGCTLWTNIPEDYEYHVGSGFSDYHLIYTNQGEELTTTASKAIFQDHLAYIKDQLSIATEKGQNAIVFTHHAPHMNCFVYATGMKAKAQLMVLNERQDILLYGCCTDLTDVLSHAKESWKSLMYWCYGHIHISKDEIIGNTRVVSNQVGYKKGRHQTNSTHDPMLVLSTIPPKDDSCITS